MLYSGGKLPAKIKAALESEGLEFVEEGVFGSIVFRQYRSPQRYSFRGRRGFCGALAITSHRLLAGCGHPESLDVAFNHQSFRTLQVKVDRANRLCISYDAAQFYSDRSGKVELRFETPQAHRAAALLQKQLQWSGVTHGTQLVP